ncbi:MAG: DNA/RNA non-specific endonuclease [Bacteroidales bacterium]|nr:DNA/RNA non-specific endonuclease [Bacteroidales bacterium]
MKTDKFIRRILPAVLLGALLAGAVSCGGDKGGSEDPVAPATLTLKANPVTSEFGTNSATVSAKGSWTVTSSADWLTLCPLKTGESRETAKSSVSGSGDATIVYYYTINPVEEARTATLTLTAGSQTAKVVLTQKGLVEVKGQKIAKVKWMELPQTSETDNLYFFYHDMTVGSKKIRNYSFYWDYSNLISSWVAYPLNSNIKGSGTGRTEAWGVDPLIPREKQQVVESRAYRLPNGSGAGYSRGHQIPSADRQANYSANAQTYYGTNMTPQDFDFNGGTWANLEALVREWADKAATDTLYVCTGAVAGSGHSIVYDNDWKAVAVPTAYFKALLVHERSSYHNFDATDGWSACAFWFGHSEYSVSGKNKLGKEQIKPLAISVEELEKKLGYQLFVNLPDKIGADKAATVKKTDPKMVSWWK